MPRPGPLIAIFLLSTPAAARPSAISNLESRAPAASAFPAATLHLTFPSTQPTSAPQPANTTTTPSATPASDATPTTLSLFGSEGSDWLTLSTGIAKDFDESTDFNISLAWSTFLVDNVDFGVEAAVWYFDQEQDPALGLNATPFLRWHFVARESWSIFTDAGLGLCLSSDDVPDGGTSFTFTPRAGFGATFRIADDGTRLEVGARWQHFSNARLTGDQDNPGRDEPMLYVGIIFPF